MKSLKTPYQIFKYNEPIKTYKKSIITPNKPKYKQSKHHTNTIYDYIIHELNKKSQS